MNTSSGIDKFKLFRAITELYLLMNTKMHWRPINRFYYTKLLKLIKLLSKDFEKCFY